VPAPHLPATAAATPPRSAVVAPSPARAAVPQVGSAAAPQVAVTSPATRPVTPAAPVLDTRPRESDQGSATPDRPHPDQATRPTPGGTAERTAPVSASPPSGSPTAPPEPARAPNVPAKPNTPGPFDRKLAQQQLDIAAFKASTCGQLGQTKGAGEVSVTVESWGRVVRVSHLNPAFVGTPVGLCVTQAFQQLQVPPFSGGPQSLTGSFIIQ
jgi:hypothetical protein